MTTRPLSGPFLLAGLELRGLLSTLESTCLKTPPRPISDWDPPSAHDLNGEMPRVELTDFIGRGSMGAVFRGRQTDLDREIAIKLLPVEFVRSAEMVERFRQEARAASRLRHPGIVSIYDCGQTSRGQWYLLMQLVDGVTLRSLLEEGPLDATQAVQITVGLCEALQHAHDNGVIHRNVKPSNILITESGDPILADFGVATFRDQREASGLTEDGTVIGTVGYAAPEQQQANASVDHRADLFAVGVVLYEMLTGCQPIGNWSLPSQVRSGVAPSLDTIVRKLLAPLPEHRFASATEVISALRRAFEGSPRRTWARRLAAVAALITGLTFAAPSIDNPANETPATGRTTSATSTQSFGKTPTFTLADELSIIGPEFMGANVGTSIASDGQLAVVGAPFLDGGSSGVVFVLERNDAGTPDDASDDAWTEAARLSPADPVPGMRFGRRVATSGDWIAVCSSEAGPVKGGSGTIRLFRRMGAGWRQMQALESPMPQDEKVFGYSIALADDRLVVGQRGHVVRDTGAAFVFQLDDQSRWQFEQQLEPDDLAAGAQFGTSVAIVDNRIAVGAPNQDAVFTFRHGRSGWQSDVRIRHPENGVADFGMQVLLTDSQLVVLAPRDRTKSAQQTAVVHVFDPARPDSAGEPAWTHTQVLVPRENAHNKSTGFWLAGTSTTLAIGGAGDGTVHTWQLNDGRWQQPAGFPATENSRIDSSGSAAFAGDTLLVGSRRAHGNAHQDGVLNTFSLDDIGWRRWAGCWSPKSARAPVEYSKAHMGAAMAAGDGFLAIGIHGLPVGDVPLAGAVQIHSTSPAAMSEAGDAMPFYLVAPAGVNVTRFGCCLAAFGDMLAVAARSPADQAHMQGGHVFLYRNRDDGWMLTQTLSVPLATDSTLPTALTLDADTLAVGNAGNHSTGAVHVFARHSDQWEFTQTLLADNPEPGDRFGLDLLLDNHQLLVGAPGPGKKNQQTGSVTVYQVVHGHWKQHQQLSTRDSLPRDCFGTSLAVTEGWLAIGATHSDVTASDGGSVHVYRKDGNLWQLHQQVIPNTVTSGAHFGQSVAWYDDRLVVGAANDSQAFQFAGSVAVFGFDGTRWRRTQSILPPAPSYKQQFGHCITRSGESLIIGAPGENNWSGRVIRFLE